MLDHAAAFQQPRLVGFTLEDLLMSALNDIAQVRLQFHHLASAINDINTVVVIKEQGAVVEVAHTGNLFPRSLCLLSREDVGVAHRPLLVGSKQGIELAIMVFQRGRPLATAVCRSYFGESVSLSNT